MTLDIIGEIVAERQGRQFDIPFRKLCEELVVMHRARLLTNSLQKNPAQKKLYSNSIIVELEQVNKDECDELGGCEGSDVKRTKVDIPEVLRIGTSPYDFLGSPGGDVAFSWTTFGAETFYSHNKYTKKKPRYTRLNNRVYIFNDNNVEKIRIEDVFSDPRKLANFSCSAATSIPCYKATSDFITDEALTQLVIESILSKFGPSKDEAIEVKMDKNV